MDEKWEEQFETMFEDYPSDLSVQKGTLKKRAYQARPILVDIAEEGETDEIEPEKKYPAPIEYGELAEKIDSDAAYMSKVLGAIDLVADMGDMLDEPPLSPLVVSAGTVGPGRGYFNWDYFENCDNNYMKDGGEGRNCWVKNPDDKSSLTHEMKGDWISHLCETYEYNGWYELD